MIGVTLGSNLGRILDRSRTSVRSWGNGGGGDFNLLEKGCIHKIPGAWSNSI